MDERLTTECYKSLINRGLRLEYVTIAWNVVAVGLLFFESIRTGSTAILGFGLDSFIEIGASFVVVWQLRNAGESRRRQALRMISIMFACLVAYIGIASIVSLARHVSAGTSRLGIVWLFLTFLAMLALAAGKERVGRKIANPLLRAEARVTLVDAYLASIVLFGLVLNGYAGWWWADPVAGLAIVVYGIRESRHAWEQSRTRAI